MRILVDTLLVLSVIPVVLLKGVLLSHSNIMSTIGGMDDTEVTITKNDSYISYLPMTHIFE